MLKVGLLESWESLSGEELESRLYPPARRSPAQQAERPLGISSAHHGPMSVYEHTQTSPSVTD